MAVMTPQPSDLRCAASVRESAGKTGVPITALGLHPTTVFLITVIILVVAAILVSACEKLQATITPRWSLEGTPVLRAPLAAGWLARLPP